MAINRQITKPIIKFWKLPENCWNFRKTINMKQLSIIILFALVAGSCQKGSSDVAKTGTSAGPVVTPAAPPPSANFRISNAINATSIWEMLKLTFENSSKNADSYFWDFGNGITSTDKIPQNIEFAPCSMTYTITLTVKSKDGQSSTFSAPYFVACSRGMGFGAHGE